MFYKPLGPRTFRIGPRTVVKYGVSVDLSEAEAMRFVSEHTSIPIPKVYSAWKYAGMSVIKMNYIQGTSAWRFWDTLSPLQQHTLMLEIESYVNQLRNLTPPSPSAVSSTTGGPFHDHRLGTRLVDPFKDHDDFHRFLRKDANIDSLDASKFGDVIVSHTEKYASKFTHGDLLPRNVILQGGNVAAIIDWDSAGWRPEYWEFTKVHFSSLGTPSEWIDALRRATGDYSSQLKGEGLLWNFADFPADC